MALSEKSRERKPNPEFTIVIPAYNAEKYLNRSIQSVLNQTCGDYEIIVVDDGSTDKTLGILNEISDLRLHTFTQKNRGVSAARNKGIEEARGAYIAFLDADDEWHPNFLSTMRNLIQRFPEAGLYSAGCRMMFTDGSPVDTTITETENTLIDDYFQRVMVREIVHTSSVVIPSRIFERVGNYINNSAGQDLEMWGRIALKYKVAYSPKIMNLFYQTPQGEKPRYKDYPAFNPRLRLLSDYLLSDQGTDPQNKDNILCLIKSQIRIWALMFAFNGDFERMRKFLALPECRHWRPAFCAMFSSPLLFPVARLWAKAHRAYRCRFLLKLRGGKMARHGVELRLADRDEEPFL